MQQESCRVVNVKITTAEIQIFSVWIYRCVTEGTIPGRWDSCIRSLDHRGCPRTMTVHMGFAVKQTWSFKFCVHSPISCIVLDRLPILIFTNCKLNITIAVMRTARQWMHPQSEPQELHARVLWHSIILFVAVSSYIFPQVFLKIKHVICQNVPNAIFLIFLTSLIQQIFPN